MSKENFHNISLGQGQEIVAEKAIDLAAKKGHWVVLQVGASPIWTNLIGQIRFFSPLASIHLINDTTMPTMFSTHYNWIWETDRQTDRQPYWWTDRQIDR